MTLPDRMIEPTRFVTAEKVQWYKQLDDYPATGWTLTYSFRGPGTGFDVTCTADGTAHVATIAASATTSILSGVTGTQARYSWQARVIQIGASTTTYVIGEGFVTIVKAMPAGTAAFENRSTAKQIIDGIDAAILAFTSSDAQEYTIETPAGKRTVKRSDKDSLMAMRKHYAAIYAQEQARERARKGGSLMQSVGVRFNDV